MKQRMMKSSRSWERQTLSNADGWDEQAAARRVETAETLFLTRDRHFVPASAEYICHLDHDEPMRYATRGRTGFTTSPQMPRCCDEVCTTLGQRNREVERLFEVTTCAAPVKDDVGHREDDFRDAEMQQAESCDELMS
jgi:hypothetical protein